MTLFQAIHTFDSSWTLSSTGPRKATGPFVAQIYQVTKRNGEVSEQASDPYLGLCSSTSARWPWQRVSL